MRVKHQGGAVRSSARGSPIKNPSPTVGEGGMFGCRAEAYFFAAGSLAGLSLWLLR